QAAHTKGASPQSLAALYVALARLSDALGHFKEAVAHAERAEQLAQTAQDHRLLARSGLWRSNGLAGLGRLEETFQTAEQVIMHAEKAGDLESLCDVYYHLACVYEERGLFTRAQHYFRQGLERAEELGDPTLMAQFHAGWGRNHYLAGNWEQARTDYELAAT